MQGTVVRWEVKVASVACKAPAGEFNYLTGWQPVKSQETQSQQAAWASWCEVWPRDQVCVDKKGFPSKALWGL